MSENFLLKLQQEAQLQARLEKNQFLPKKMGGVLSFIATHSWQVLVMVSFITALGVSFL